MTTFSLRIEGKNVATPSDDEIRGAVEALESAPSSDNYVSVSDTDSQASLVVYFVPALGFYVSGSGKTDVDYYTAIDGSEDVTVVSASVAGERGDYERRAFIGLDAAVEAVREFVRTGRRAEAMQWIEASELMK